MSIVMTGGGTGGHLAIIKAVKEALMKEQGTGSREQGAGSTEHRTQNTEHRAGSREQGAGASVCGFYQRAGQTVV